MIIKGADTMRISRRAISTNREADFENEIQDILSASSRNGRVCSEDCTIACEACGSTVCQCMCHSECHDAPTLLSSDPDRFPIEARIVPLVFEMKQEGTCSPCWSCEGHNRPDGSLWKIPRVWFYSPSVTHLRLIGSGIHTLFLERKTNAAWQVVITHSDPDNIDTTFSLEPALSSDTVLSLCELQADIRIIAETWSDFLKHEARKLAQTVIKT